MTSTPGPWAVDRRASTRVVDNADTTIAVAGMASRVMEEAQANARLIAAAPELLEALQELVEVLGDRGYVPDSFTTQPARLAIQKATGGAA